MTKEEIKSRMKHLARKFCRRNRVYEEFDGSVGKLIEKSYLSAYLLCLHENKNKITELEKDNAELKADFIKSCKVKEQGFKEAEQALERKDKQLTKAKKIIGNLYAICKDNHYPNSSVLMEQAEQFLNSEVEK